jgi:hypothetical protein
MSFANCVPDLVLVLLVGALISRRLKFLMVLELRRMLDVPDFSLIGLDEIESGRHWGHQMPLCPYVAF